MSRKTRGTSMAAAIRRAAKIPGGQGRIRSCAAAKNYEYIK